MIISQQVEQSLARRATAPSRVVKRLLDVVLSSAGLVLAFPVITLAALAIKAGDSGSTFYRRRVTGPRGDFDAFKLRTMRADADRLLENDAVLKCKFDVNFKLEDDPRVTRVGRFLRRWSLDELPQLWNVLKGEMSVVGPRMVTSQELQKYGPNAWVFLVMKPGMTGYWQVRRRRETSYAERVDMDVFYAEHRSFLFDLKIFVQTPLAILRGAEKGKG